MARQMGALPAKVNLFRKCERSFRLRAGQFRKHRWRLGAPWGNYDEKRNPAPPGGSRADFHRRRDRHLAPRPVHPCGRDVRRRTAGRDRAVDPAQIPRLPLRRRLRACARAVAAVRLSRTGPLGGMAVPPRGDPAGADRLCGAGRGDRGDLRGDLRAAAAAAGHGIAGDRARRRAAVRGRVPAARPGQRRAARLSGHRDGGDHRHGPAARRMGDANRFRVDAAGHRTAVHRRAGGLHAQPARCLGRAVAVEGRGGPHPTRRGTSHACGGAEQLPVALCHDHADGAVLLHHGRGRDACTGHRTAVRRAGLRGPAGRPLPRGAGAECRRARRHGRAVGHADYGDRRDRRLCPHAPRGDPGAARG